MKPTDEAIRELIARFLMEFGGEWTNWSKWDNDDFIDWYCEWCKNNWCHSGIELHREMNPYFNFDRTRYRMRVSKHGKEFLK